MFAKVTVLAVVAGVALSGCGTLVPSIQEFPAGSAEGQLLVHAIVRNITCEVQDAVNDVIRGDREDARNFGQPRLASWLESWGVQTTLTLTIDEKTATNPTINWLPIPPVNTIINIAAGANVSAGATRVEKVKSFYTVKDLLALGRCPEVSRPGGPQLLQSDLKLREWLHYNVMLGGTGEINFPTTVGNPFSREVLQHEVRFEVITNASATPTFRLTRIAFNPTGTFLSTGRTRTHGLIVTLGPTDQPSIIATRRGDRVAAPARVGPGRAASDSHLASEIGESVANSIRNAVQPPPP